MSSPERARPKVAVFGVGHLGSVHARILSARADVELAAVVDTSAERVQHVAHEVRCPARLLPSSAPGDVLEACPAGVSAVVIAVPTRFHAAVAVPLLERGIGCLVEKPLAHDLESARAILAAARRGGATLSVGHVERFQPGIRKVRDLRLAPRFIECQRLAPFSFRSTDIGVVHDLMIHDLDLVLDLVDSPVRSLDAAGGAILTEHEDMASVRLVFENGARANITASRASLQPTRRLRMFSSSAYVSLDLHKNYGLLVKKGPRWVEGRSALSNLTPEEIAARTDLVSSGMLELAELDLAGGERPLQAELESFLACVRERRIPEVTGEDGYRALELAERIAAEIRSQAW
ncbi:MAG: Gfo/Idh/MocA family oxidoreductase [Planctomycetes bacterium]|nr:Gfo/Idh/MocA family oxidoreductase [Planctomycetota bacterium]